MTERNVGILVFDDVEVLDFCGPFEVFSSATRPGEEERDERRLYRALIIAEQLREIHCRGGLLVHPHYAIDAHPLLDLIVVPGGFGTRRQIDNPRLLDWIVRQNERTELTTSVCTGAFLLAKIGLLDGKRATTHWASIDWLRDHFPSVTVVNDERVVDAGRVITSAGVSAGIDMALHVVERQHGLDIALETARGMEYERPSIKPQASSPKEN
jgi:transcriptional regulator GlxA family with amidase domain